MQTAVSTTSQKSPKAKKIEDIVKPDATMRLHQRLFDRRRKHHIDIKEEGTASPGASLDAYLIPARYRQTSPTTKKKLLASPALVTTAPVPVVRYSEITRDLPIESYLTSISNHARSFMDRVAQRYHVFVSQHKPFYYSLSSGTASGWLTNPRSRIALAGSALALLLFFTGAPSPTPTGPDNPAGTNNPIVIQDTSHGSNTETAHQAAPASTNTSNATKPAPSTTATVAAPSTPAAQPENTSVMNGLIYEGGRGSGPASPPASTTTTQPNQQNTTTPTTPTTSNLIQDVIKPTPITVPGQDILVDDKRILKTTDTTILIN